MADQELNILVRLKDEASAQLRNLNTEIAANKKEWESNFGAIISQVRQASIALVAFGGAVTFGLLGAVRGTIELRQELRRLSAMTGMSAGAAKDFYYAAERSGIGAGRAAFAVLHLERALDEARRGTSEYVQALSAIGLSYSALQYMTPEQQIETVVRALADVEDPARRAATSITLFGRSGPEIVTMFGPLGQLEGAFSDAARSVDDLKSAVTTVLTPALAEGAGNIANIINAINNWISVNPGLASSIGGVVAAVGGIALVLGTIGATASFVLPMIVAGIVAIASPVGAVVAAIVAIGATIVAVAAQWEDFKRAFTMPVTGIINIIKGEGWDGIAELTEYSKEILVKLKPETAEVQSAISSLPSSINIPVSFDVSVTGETLPSLHELWEARLAAAQRAGLTSRLTTVIRMYQYGGIVPGPIGAPIPIIAHGGERFLGAGKEGGAGAINVTLNVAGSIRSDTDIAALIRREILWIRDRNYTAGLA